MTHNVSKTKAREKCKAECVCVCASHALIEFDDEGMRFAFIVDS